MLNVMFRNGYTPGFIAPILDIAGLLPPVLQTYALSSGSQTFYNGNLSCDGVLMGAGITADSFAFSREGINLVLTFTNGVRLVLKNQFAGDAGCYDFIRFTESGQDEINLKTLRVE